MAPDAAAILDQLATAVLVVDAHSRVLALNQAAADLLATSPAAARGRPLASLVADGAGIEQLLVRSRTTEERLAARDFVLSPTARSDARYQVDVSLTPFPAMTPGCVLLEIADTTRPSRMTRDAALLVQQGGSRVMARQLAHEIKNPLGGLRGAAQLLERELHEHLREYTGVIISEADRLTALVDSMIGPARAPQKALINVHELCEHVYRLLRSEARAGVLVERDYDPSLPNAEVDANQIIQALLNIARNALLAVGERGRIVIRTRIAANVSIGTTRHKLAASVSVEDNGPGVPPEIADTIFFPLVTGRANGTGLGLAVSQDLVTRHGGLIEFESKPGRTVFTILLPLPENA